MKMIYLIKAKTSLGDEYFWAGAENEVDALLMAAQRDYSGENVSAKQVPNKVGVQLGEWKRAI